MSNKLFLIGIDKYVNIKALNSSAKGVIDFKTVLLERYHFNEEDVYELINDKATNKNIQDSLNGYVKTTTINDNLVIFFSGHGGYDEKSERGFWVPVDGGLDYTSWIPNETIIAILNKINCKHIFVISDSCFSNSILVRSSAKSNMDYAKYASRWALTSAYNEAIDSDQTSNTLFAETIINFLENAESDVRVSELIEAVKRAFLVNVIQKPQGYPLLVFGHKGGEFVFTVKQGIDQRNLKGYSDFKKTLQLYKRNSQFSELPSHEDKTKKIGYQIFQEVDSVVKKVTFYLYLYEGIIQTQTLKYLQENLPQIFKEKNLIIFIPRDKNIANPEVRKRNISEKFKPINLFFIDDFIREQCTPKIIQEDRSNFLSISNFVLPILNQGQQNETINEYLIGWFEKNNDPILIIKGTGGIGKTTFSQFVADTAQNKYPQTTILFIDSVLIKDTLLKSKHNGQYKIYNFYEALYEITDSISEKLTEEVFRINIDAGNILLIIDGLDEVISKIPNFNVKEFLKSIDDSSDSLGGGKAIITCRTHFWDSADFVEEKFSVIELEPFNKSQAKQFFQKSFGDDDVKIKKAIKLANEFRYPKAENQNVYDPYVLDIVRSLINSEKESIEVDLSEFSSKLLDNNIKNDYIIYRVCDRERKRVGQIKVDDQITFFIYLAVEKRGVIKLENLKNSIEESLKRSIDLTNSEAFKSHPFLKYQDSNITFRYDFLADLFRGIYIASYLDSSSSEKPINHYFTDVVSENCWIGSTINQDIANRISRWNEDDIVNVISLMEKLIRFGQLAVDKKRKVVANLFNLCISINHKFLGNDVIHNTELLKLLFSTKMNLVEQLSIINVGIDQNIRFDFSGLTIQNSFIDNYALFWNCNFDDTTKFIKCHFINLSFNRKISTISKAQFVDCTYDNEMESSLKRIELTGVNKIEQSKIFLNDFFHLFFSNGRLGRQWEAKIIRPRYYGINKYNHDYKTTIKLLKRKGLLVSAEEKEGIKFFIPDNHKEDVIRFIKDGTISNVINEVIKEL